MLLQASESALCSWLSGEAPWVAVAPIDDGPMESDVAPHVVEDPVALLCSVMSCASSGVTNICGSVQITSGSPIYVGYCGIAK